MERGAGKKRSDIRSVTKRAYACVRWRARGPFGGTQISIARLETTGAGEMFDGIVAADVADGRRSTVDGWMDGKVSPTQGQRWDEWVDDGSRPTTIASASAASASEA